MKDLAFLCLAASSAIFATLWIISMTWRHAAAQRHLAAIGYASTFSYTAAGKAIRFLKLYQAGRHDLIAVQFPEFRHWVADGDDDA